MGYSAIKKPPFVTVLMTVYNGLPYLPQAIESVLGQTFSDFEFLIIDDASTDNSLACIRSYTDPRIRLICNEKNIGQACSLNKGLQLARGVYVARLDQDDLCLPERLQKQVALLQKRRDVTVVGSLMRGIDTNGRSKGHYGRQLDDFATFVALLLVGDCPIAHPSVMFQREAIARLGGYDGSFSPAEDYHLWTRVALQRYSAAVIAEPLLLYRIHKGQQSNTRAAIQRKNLHRAHEKMIEVFCNGRFSRLVSLLLRIDDAFWKECGSKREFEEVMQALGEMLIRVRTVLELSSLEFANLMRVVYRRLGPGARLWPRFMGYPAVLSYPAFFLLSPLLIPRARRASSWVARRVRELRNVAGRLKRGTPHGNKGVELRDPQSARR
jgi:glycosyltransferase involved in cell wall biosynthesis